MSRFRSLWQTSIQATKRAIKGSWDDLMPPSEKIVFHFNSKDEIKRWHLYADSELGGFSSASLEIPDTDSGAPLTGVFSGNLSLDLDEGSTWKMKRSGFCGMRSKRFDGFIDLDSYNTIAMRLRGDGRCYISTRTGSIHLANRKITHGKLLYMYQRTPDTLLRGSNCQNVKCEIPLDRYLPTWRGNVINANLEMNPSRVVGMALSVNAEGGVPGAKTGPGDFRMEIDWIKALRS